MEFKSDKDCIKFKIKLKEYCLLMLEQRLQNAKNAMLHAQQAANENDKASPGDKYETSRAMNQIDRDMFARQTEEASRDLNAVQLLKTDSIFKTVNTGAVVFCNSQCYFICLGLGVHELEGKKIIFLSPASPLAHQLKDKKQNDSCLLQGKKVELNMVF